MIAQHSSGLPAPHTHRTHLHNTQVELTVEIASVAALHTTAHCTAGQRMALRLAMVAACCTGSAALAASKPWGGGQSASKPPRELLGRGAYAHFETIPTRWNDMDAQQHVWFSVSMRAIAAMAYRPTRLRRRPAPSTRRSLRTGTRFAAQDGGSVEGSQARGLRPALVAGRRLARDGRRPVHPSYFAALLTPSTRRLLDGVAVCVLAEHPTH